MPSIHKQSATIMSQDGVDADPATTPDQRLNSGKQVNAPSVIDAALRFFANASNGTLGACAVGLCASTYLVLGRLGLVLIGAVGGIVLHATWESQNNGGLDATAGEINHRRKELGIEVVRRVLDWKDQRSGNTAGDEPADGQKAEETSAPQVLCYSDFPPATGEALTHLTDAVIRDYVKWWYGPLLPKDESFPAVCRGTFTRFIRSLSNHLSRKRTADPFLDFLANSTSIIIVFLNELSTALKASQGPDAEEAINTYLQFQPDSNLANVLNPAQQERKLSLVADDILLNFLDSKSYNCPPVKVFLQHVLSGLILEGTVTTCSKPEWINEWIVYLLEEGEPEIMNAIDAGVEDMSGAISNAQEAPDVSKGRDFTHQRHVSRAEEAMEEAMREAQRLNAMIAEDEARRRRALRAADSEDTGSIATTEGGMATPTSSDSGRHKQEEHSMVDSMIFDSEGNAMPSAAPSPSRESSSFISFDQLGPALVPTAQQPSHTRAAPSADVGAPPLTLQNASITILDLSDTNDRSAIKQKPTGEYLLQIEPASQRYPGWMISRKYSDFEYLHETIRRIAVIAGVAEFAQQYSLLPTWKGQTRASLIQTLENYLRHALKFEPLAESEAMKKFLEKDTGLAKAPSPSKNVLTQGSTALENVGKNFINVLGQGGKGIAGGGKAVLGGVQGVFGAVATGVGAQRKMSSAPKSYQPIVRTDTTSASLAVRPSQELTRRSTESVDAVKPPLLPARSSLASPSRSERSSSSSREGGQVRFSQESLSLPPLPSDVADDYVPVPLAKPETPPRDGSGTNSSRPATPTPWSRSQTPNGASNGNDPVVPPPTPLSKSQTPNSASNGNDPVALPPTPLSKSQTPHSASNGNDPVVPPPQTPARKAKNDFPITEEETRISIELMFAIITELYSLSSAWTIRLSLLTAAKTFLLRPNNPQLDSIRSLLQESVIEANFSDNGLAGHINKLRENTLPTEEERAQWPKEMTAEEKENLRVKARRLLVERGMPQALTSVMGAAASGEALGRVFDCLQVEEVARGLIFALLLQAIRAVTQ